MTTPAVITKLFKLFTSGEPLTIEALSEFHSVNEEALTRVVPSKAYSKRLVALLQKPGKEGTSIEVLPAVLLNFSSVCTNATSFRNLLQEELGKCINEVRLLTHLVRRNSSVPINKFVWFDWIGVDFFDLSCNVHTQHCSGMRANVLAIFTLC